MPLLTPHQWRERSEKARSVAAKMRSDSARRMMLGIAKSCEHLADSAERLEGEDKGETSTVAKKPNALLFSDGETELDTAERHVAEQERRVAKQLELIERLRSKERPTQEAERFLDELRSTLAVMVDHRDSLRSRRKRTGAG